MNDEYQLAVEMLVTEIRKLGRHIDALERECDLLRDEKATLKELAIRNERWALDKETRIADLEAENARLREQLEEATLARIEAQNPGIDMEEVKATRGAAWQEADVPTVLAPYMEANTVLRAENAKLREALSKRHKTTKPHPNCDACDLLTEQEASDG